MKSPQSAEHRPIAEMIRGAQTAMASLRSAILLISTPPAEWRAEKASSLGGVIVVPQDVTPADLDVLKTRNLPYITFTESSLPGPRVTMGQGKAAKHMTEQLLRLGHRRIALLSGFDVALDATKRIGIHEALHEAGIEPGEICEVSAHGNEAEIFDAARSVLELRPRPTAVIAFDDSLGAVMNYHARRQAGIQVPEELSIVSFNDWPYLHFAEVPLTTVRFDFFAAGQRAAETLSHAALTGQPVPDLTFEPIYRAGASLACAPQPISA